MYVCTLCFASFINLSSIMSVPFVSHVEVSSDSGLGTAFDPHIRIIRWLGGEGGHHEIS